MKATDWKEYRRLCKELKFLMRHYRPSEFSSVRTGDTPSEIFRYVVGRNYPSWLISSLKELHGLLRRYRKKLQTGEYRPMRKHIQNRKSYLESVFDTGSWYANERYSSDCIKRVVAGPLLKLRVLRHDRLAILDGVKVQDTTDYIETWRVSVMRLNGKGCYAKWMVESSPMYLSFVSHDAKRSARLTKTLNGSRTAVRRLTVKQTEGLLV